MKFSSLFLIWLMIGFPLLALGDSEGDFEEIRLIQPGNLSQSDTLYLLDRAFANRRMDYLEGISTANFRSLPWYREFEGYIRQGKRINLNYRSEMATQTFIINNDQRHLLFIDFEKSRVDNRWYAAGAYIVKNGREIPVEEYGFTPNDIELNFEQLARELTNGKDTCLYHKIRSKLPNKYQISPTWEKTLKMDDIIIYDSSYKQKRIFLILKYYPPSQPEDGGFKSGWLIDEGGPLHFVLDEPNRDIAIANLLEALKPPESLTTPQQSSTGEKAQLSTIQCNFHPQQRYFRIKFEWQHGNSVPVQSIIRNIKTYVGDKKIELIGKHKHVEVSSKCSNWLNIQPSMNGTMIVLKHLFSAGKIQRTKSYLFINLYEPNRDTATANLPEVLGRVSPESLTIPQQWPPGEENQLSAIQCRNYPEQRYFKIIFEWQHGNSVPVKSIIRNLKTYVGDKKIELIGKHEHIKVSYECSNWLNVQSSMSGTMIVLKRLFSAGKIQRTKSYLLINLYY